MGGLTNGYVQWIMRRASFKPRAFKGVLPCDLFLEYIKANKNNIKPGDCFILNLSSSNSKGTHFVCFFVLDSRTGEYFDSYGLPSFDSNLNRAFKLTKLDISPFEMRLQSDTSQFCGLFCIAYLLFRQRFTWRQKPLKNNRRCVDIFSIHYCNIFLFHECS